MKTLLALAFVSMMPVQARADVPCLGGAPDIFKFVKWDFKTVEDDTTEVTLTLHNATNQTFKKSEIKFRYGEWHQFFFRLEIPAPANSDVTFMNPFGMGAKSAKELQVITPTLCAVQTVDESGTKKDYE